MTQKLKTSIYGQGLPIVFLHGWGLNSGVWQPVIELMEDRYQIITVDLPGFGLNYDTVTKPYDLANIANQVVASVDQPAVYMGWSLGGLIASEIAINHQDQCLGLITVASSPCFKQQGSWPGIKPVYLSAFYHQLNKDIEQTLKNFLKIQAMGSPHIRQDLKEIQQLIMAFPLPNKEALKAGLDLLDSVDLRDSLKQVRQPFLRLYGKLDSLVPAKTAGLVDSLSPDSEVISFDKASHAPFISHRECFVRQLNQWLAHQYTNQSEPLTEVDF